MVVGICVLQMKKELGIISKSVGAIMKDKTLSGDEKKAKSEPIKADIAAKKKAQEDEGEKGPAFQTHFQRCINFMTSGSIRNDNSY